jgi:hypothetical protein
LKVLFDKFSFISKVLCYVKDEGINLAITTTSLKFVISCDALNLPVHFDDVCFGHVLSKVAQYVTNDDKISKELMPISMKFAQLSFQSCITWSKNKYVDNMEFFSASVCRSYNV